jgi:hypothetical protein
MPDEDGCRHPDCDYKRIRKQHVADTLAFHQHHPEGYGIDLHAERESFVEHIADAFRTLVNDGHIKPGIDTRIVIYQCGDSDDGWRASIEYLRPPPGAPDVRLIT